MKVAEWKIDIFKADAQKVASEIEELAEVTPEAVLEKAKSNPNSELYKCFEWNDTVAAEKYRLEQARKVIITLVYKEPEVEEKEAPAPIRLYYNTDKNKVYKPISVIMRNEDEYAKLLNRAKEELRAFKVKYKMLSELSNIFELID